MKKKIQSIQRLSYTTDTQYTGRVHASQHQIYNYHNASSIV
jgi:hypothetical protein